MSEATVSERLAQHFAENSSDAEYAALFSPMGLARHVEWLCEDGWLVGYTTSAIRSSVGGRNDGKFAWFTYKPIGKGARSGEPTEWERTKITVVGKRKTARARAERFYYKHSPKAARRHGVKV
jgi:hypothetical protein